MPRAGMIFGIAGLWALLFVLSFIVFATTEPLDSGFTKGLNRVGEWLKWQAAALVAAVGLFIFARNQVGNLTRQETWIANAPLVISGGIAGILILAALYVLLFLE
jgi:hypothetical protein